MATVIEPGVVGSDAIRRVAFLTGESEPSVLGRIVMLWTSSQAAGVAEANESLIAFWLNINSEDTEKWINALCDPAAGFIKIGRKKQFLISGNSRHIKKQKAIKRARSEAAKKRWDKEKNRKSVENKGESENANQDANALLKQGGLYANQNALTKLNQAKLNQAKLNINKADLEKLISTWKETLKHFGINRDTGLHYGAEIGRAVQAFGAESVKLALIGARYEKGSEGFNPKNHISIHRVLDPARIEKFINLGAQSLSQPAIDESVIKAENERIDRINEEALRRARQAEVSA